MKAFLGFIKKEFIHIFRDFKTMIILFGIPVTQIMIFGYAVTNEISNVKVIILDNAKDEISRDIIHKIEASRYFMIADYIQDPNDIEAYFKKGDVKEAIIFEKDLEKKLRKEGTASIQLILDAIDANTATLIESYTSSIIRTSVNEKYSNPQLIRIQPEFRMLYNENMEGTYMFVPGTMALILILISAMMTSISITKEKELGTMEILLVSPLRPTQIIIGKVIPYFFLSFINAVIILALSYFVFDVPIYGNFFLLMALSMLFIMMALSLGIMISTLSSSQQSAMMISIFVLMLPTMLLSGFIFPIDNMPTLLQLLSNVVPAKWYISIVKKIMLVGVDFQFVIKETLILFGMCILFIGVSIKRFKIRLD